MDGDPTSMSSVLRGGYLLLYETVGVGLDASQEALKGPCLEAGSEPSAGGVEGGRVEAVAMSGDGGLHEGRGEQGAVGHRAESTQAYEPSRSGRLHRSPYFGGGVGAIHEEDDECMMVD